jgi:hypothetical protein
MNQNGLKLFIIKLLRRVKESINFASEKLANLQRQALAGIKLKALC